MSLRPPTGFKPLTEAASFIDKREASDNVNLAGVVTRVTKCGRGRGQDFHLVFYMTDEFLGPEHELEISIFKRYKNDLPICNSGDVVLVRNIKYKGSGWDSNYLSNHATTVMVVNADDIFQNKPGFWNHTKLSREEKTYVQFLGHWSKETIRTISKAIPPTIGNFPKSREVVQLMHVKADSFYNIFGEVVRIYSNPGLGTMSIYITDYTQNQWFHHYDNEPQEEACADTEGKDTDIPVGKKTLQVTLFEPHCYWVERQRNLLGKYVEIDNVHIKFTQYFSGEQLEGKLHTDRLFPDKLCIRICKDDKLIKRIEDQKRIYAAAMARRKLEHSKELDASGKPSKGQKKKERQEFERRELEAKRKELEETGKLNSIDTVLINKSVKSLFSYKPPQTLHSILTSTLLQGRGPAGEPISFPFMNVCFRATVRVVDFYPPRLEDFAQSLTDSKYVDTSDASVESNDMDLDEPQPGYEWMFYLIIEDLEKNPSGEKIRMPLLVHGKDADYLLNLNATNLKRDVMTLQKLRHRLFILWGDIEEKKREGILGNGECISNRAFTCCIKEYGAPDGNGGFIRMHKIFNTVIHAD